MSTQAERRKLRNQLGKDMSRWLKMNDEDLYAEAKKAWPMISQASREECIKFLTLLRVDEMVK